MSRRQLSPAAAVFVILLVPLVIPVLFVLLGPSADRARAQELGPKQAFVPPVRPSAASPNSGSTARRAVNARTRTKAVATATPAKPSGKMEFVPDSPAPRANRTTATARSAANAVARRQVPAQPAKVAATRSTPQAAPRLPASSISTPPALPPAPVVESIAAAASEPIEEPIEELMAEPIEELMAEPEPVQIAKKPVQIVKKKELEVPDLEVPEESFEEPEVLVRSLPEPPAQFSERPEPPIPDFELPVVRMPQRAMPMLEEEEVEEVEEVVVAEEEVPPAQMSRDVVQLYFEEEDSTEGDAAESMDLVEREAPEVKELADPVPLLKEQPKTFVESMPASEIRSVVAQEKPGAAKTVEPAVAPVEEAQTPSDAILAELKPVRSIEIRKAVEVPALSEMDNPQLHEPADQAGAMLRKRPPFKFWPVYRDPWVASRDSFAFHHNPLWFEDPNLERCGRGKGHFTSVSSFVQFNTNIAFLPYRMTAEPWHACVRTLPDCTVCQKFGCDAYLPPWSWRAAAVQAGCIVGFIYAIP